MMKTLFRMGGVALGLALLLPSATWGQERRTDYGLATLPEFRVETNIVGSYFNSEPEHWNGLTNRISLKEAGLGLRQYVDPFFRLDLVISGEEEQEGDGVEIEFGVEQALVTWLGAPWPGQVKIGKFQTSFGEYNDDDPDEHPQITTPDVILNYFGEDDGWLDTGINANIAFGTTIPQMFWLGTFNGENPIAFHAGTERKPVFFARYELFGELAASTGFEFGVSWAQGPNRHMSPEIEDESLEEEGDHNQGEGERTFEIEGDTTMYNVHLELDWASSRRYLYSGFSILAEYLSQKREYEDIKGLTALAKEDDWNTELEETTSGYYVLAEWQFNRNWAIAARIDSSPMLLLNLGEDDDDDDDQENVDVPDTAEESGNEESSRAYTIYSDENLTGYSAIISYYPSRFSALRFEYANKTFDDESWSEYWVQLLVLIGFERPDVF